jgi:putative FmdB family regulatory protein
MPMYEYLCKSCGTVEEQYAKMGATPPDCPVCLGPREQLFSRFAAPFSGSFHKYADPRRENAHMEGWWAYRKVSSISGQPEPVWLDTPQAVREFNKAEGLADPTEVPTNSTVSADGRKIVSDGMPGQWVRGVSGLPSLPSRLREMITVPAEQCSPLAATCSPVMPADYGVKPQVVEAPVEMG